MSDLSQLRELVARSCRVLGKLNLTKEPSGHVSARVPGDGQNSYQGARTGRVWSSLCHREDIITVDLAGKKVEGDDGLETPQEVFIHTWLYTHATRCPMRGSRSSPNRRAVSRSATNPCCRYSAPTIRRPAVTVEGLSSLSAQHYRIERKARRRVCCGRWGEKAACLMRGHGITTAGANVEEATLTAIKLNEVAEINYRASLLGTPEPISQEDIDVLGAQGQRQKQGDALRFFLALLLQVAGRIARSFRFDQAMAQTVLEFREVVKRFGTRRGGRSASVFRFNPVKFSLCLALRAAARPRHSGLLRVWRNRMMARF